MTTKKGTLLERAKAVSRRNSPLTVTPDQVEVAVAWACGDVTLSQVSRALKGKVDSSTTYSMLARALARYVRETLNEKG